MAPAPARPANPSASLSVSGAGGPDDGPSTPAALPCIVLGGWLGAGKTTLVNHLLRHAQGRRIAVAVNDFGDVSIDADLIEGADGSVLSLAGGCICCAIGSDLFSGLRAIVAREPAPDILLLETSGVALPAAVARTARLVPGIDVQGTVVLFDSQAGQEHLADRYIADTVAQQVDDADLILLSKVDLVAPSVRLQARSWLASRVPQTPVVEMSQGKIEPELLLGLAGERGLQTGSREPRTEVRGGAGGPVTAGWGTGRWKPHHVAPAAERLGFETLVFDRPIDVAALARDLTASPHPVVRAKGVVDAIDGLRYRLHIVGRRVTLQPVEGASDPTPSPTVGRVACIRWKPSKDTGP